MSEKRCETCAFWVRNGLPNNFGDCVYITKGVERKFAFLETDKPPQVITARVSGTNCNAWKEKQCPKN